MRIRHQHIFVNINCLETTTTIWTTEMTSILYRLSRPMILDLCRRFGNNLHRPTMTSSALSVSFDTGSFQLVNADVDNLSQTSYLRCVRDITQRLITQTHDSMLLYSQIFTCNDYMKIFQLWKVKRDMCAMRIQRTGLNVGGVLMMCPQMPPIGWNSMKRRDTGLNSRTRISKPKNKTKTPTKKLSSVVKKVEKKNSTDHEKTTLLSAECQPLGEPSPMTIDFEELMAIKHTTPTDDWLFSLPVIAVSDIEQSLYNTPAM